VLFSVTVPKFRIVQKLIDRINLVMRENLSGMMVVRAFNMQDFEEDRFDKANIDATNVSLFINRVMVIMFPLMMLIMNILMLGIIWFGAKQVAAANMEVGDMLAFMQYAMQIVMAFLMFSFMFIMVPRASVSGSQHRAADQRSEKTEGTPCFVQRIGGVPQCILPLPGRGYQCFGKHNLYCPAGTDHRADRLDRRRKVHGCQPDPALL
jgi:ABC-type multidrug transport system fused ATPase/permease subunit